MGPWLPEPISTEEAPELAKVEERVDTFEPISLAFLVLLEQLQPIERAVFLLREVFEYDYAEITAFSVLTIEVEAGHIQIIRGVANSEKLAHV